MHDAIQTVPLVCLIRTIRTNRMRYLLSIYFDNWPLYILIYIQQDTTLHSLFYLETALHVSGGTITHHQERKKLYVQHLVFVRPLLLPTAVNILIYIQQDATLHSLFYLETDLHVSGGTITHHQERKKLYLQHLVFVRPLLLPTAVNILIYIQQDATLHSLFYLETALHVSGGTITHHQERKKLYLQHLVFVRPLLLSAVIVEELETCRAVSR